MERMITSRLFNLELAPAQSFENMTVFPLLAPKNGGPEYITLREALERGAFAVTEISQSGSVPELMVQNKGEVAVLLLDGEELAGAKQNRVLNTTILVAPKSAVKIPVSCTEQGRWSYVSAEFAESGNVMATPLRRVNLASVNRSLETVREYRSDQNEVWDGISRLARETGVRSMTGAMKDIYAAKRTDLDDYLKSFRLAEGQKGLIVFIGGQPVGLDFLSREQAFAVLHAKLVKSYAMEAALVRGRHKKGVFKSKLSRDSGGKKAGPDAAKARDFLSRAAACEEKAYESVGEGWSYRYTGAGIVGSALAVDARIVHMAFFSASKEEESGFMAGPSRRRGHIIVD